MSETVTVRLRWQWRTLYAGKCGLAHYSEARDGTWRAFMVGDPGYVAEFSTEAEARSAVEAAVRKALGAE